MNPTPFALKLKAFRKTFRSVNLSYCDPALKASFHNRGQRLLHVLAAELGWAKDDYDIRSNKAGIACSGEIYMQSEDLYVELSQSTLFHGAQNLGGLGFMVRWVASRDVGSRNGGNHFYKLSEEAAPLVKLCQWVMQKKTNGEKPF